MGVYDEVGKMVTLVYFTVLLGWRKSPPPQDTTLVHGTIQQQKHHQPAG